MKRFLWLCLAVTMLAALFAGCGDSGTQQETSAPAQTTTAAPETAAPETDAPVDLQGYEFILYGGMDQLQYNTENEIYTRYADEIARIEKELNCVIVHDNYNAVEATEIMPAILGDTKLGDFVCSRHSTFFPLINPGYILALDSDEVKGYGLDVKDAGKWDQVYTGLSEYDEHIWGILPNGEYYICCIGDFFAFNPEITAQAGYTKDQIYDAVRNGKWNYDLFLEIARKATVDIDGDGNYDQWGMGGGVFQYAEMCATNDFSPISYDEMGTWICDFTNPRYIEALDFVGQLAGDDIRPDIDISGGGACRTLFAEGKLAFNQFYGLNIDDQDDDIFKSEFDFGIVPTPKGPSAETYTCVYPDLDAYILLSNAATRANLDKAVTVMNAIGEVITNDGWIDYFKSAFRDEDSWDIFYNYIYPNTSLNMQNATGDIWQHVRENIVLDVLLGNKTAAQAVEGQNAQIQALLDAAYGS